jgi:hypothetical protein
MDVLPNNLADFPPGKSWRDGDATARGNFGHLAAVMLLLIVVGGIIGFGAYRWIVSLDEPSLPSPPSLATPAQDDVTPMPSDVAASTPSDPAAPQLVVTGLLGNHATSQNWSGYAATEGGYTSVSATWTVPDIGLSSAAGTDAAWVGIGGVRSPDLIQAGTQHTVLQNGAAQQEAWVELLPRAPETVPLTLDPGDTIRVSIDQQGPETWLIAFTNITRGQTYQVTKRYASSLSSAEWVEEAPSGGRRRTLPLDNFGTIRFSQAATVRDTQVLNLAQSGAHAITMITPAGLHLAEPSGLGADGESFSVTRTSTPSPPSPQSPRRR